MVKVGVILSGCGVMDGAEIHESVLTLLALDRAGADVVCMAPNAELDVIDHRTNEPTGEKRNVLVESARIARGDIRDVADVSAGELDALALPGGFGAAKNLCDFATAGADARPQPDVAKLVGEMVAARKPICAMCIAPATLASILRGTDVAASLTIGTDAGTAAAIEAMGARHLDCPVEEFRVDEENRIVTTPAYMLAGGIGEAATGITRAIDELMRLAS